MSSPILRTFLLTSLLLSLPRTVDPLEQDYSSSKLLKNACTGYTKGWSSLFCLDIMKSNPKISLAQDLLYLALSIIEAGLIKATRTQIYIEDQKLKGNIQESRLAIYNQCHYLYDHIISLYKGALIHVEKHKLYDVAGGEFSMAANNAKYCENLLAISGIIDADISSGNKIMEYLSLSAYNVLNDLIITCWLTKKK